mmetsp:Transcript_9253/g.6601  ORF Transcript_9253/g.6601 Transcript_9253/m.6601 type:complete len:103 (-) Transcript_9253:213-521(-)
MPFKYTSIGKNFINKLTEDDDVRFIQFIKDFDQEGVEHIYNVKAKEVRIDPKHMNFKKVPSIMVEGELLIDGDELVTTQELTYMEKKQSRDEEREKSLLAAQ